MEFKSQFSKRYRTYWSHRTDKSYFAHASFFVVKIFCLFFLFAATATAQFKAKNSTVSGADVLAAGKPLIASYAITSEHFTQSFDKEHFFGKTPEPSIPGKKSSVLAAGLSLLVPGLGEYYVGDDIWRGMIFTGLEVGLWVERAYWNHRGDDSLAAFYKYSDTHFSQAKYALYLDSDLLVHSIDSSCNCYVPNAAQYHVAPGGNFSSLNRAEAKLDSLANYGSDPTVQNFGHRTPGFDVQQYYEIISKYLQFVAGWDDATGINFTPHMERASEMRANMNYQYQVADYFLWGIMVNHVLSAIDAALLANSHNAHLHVQGGMILRPFPDGEMGYVPTANVEYTF
ncbi:MAG TPA: hypothetical protein VG537_06025 [Candidatus Kapabacteria bacterium]|nr:hypothetical protein [Candidatus Kapabacteria bacterium]